MSDDLDDFLSELGISKTADPASSTGGGVAASSNDPNEFLDWLNEPPPKSTSAAVSEAIAQELNSVSEERAASLMDTLNDVSVISEAPTPPKLAALPLPSLEEAAAEEPAVVNDDVVTSHADDAGDDKVKDDDFLGGGFSNKAMGEEQGSSGTEQGVLDGGAPAPDGLAVNEDMNDFAVPDLPATDGPNPVAGSSFGEEAREEASETFGEANAALTDAEATGLVQEETKPAIQEDDFGFHQPSAAAPTEDDFEFEPAQVDVVNTLQTAEDHQQVEEAQVSEQDRGVESLANDDFGFEQSSAPVEDDFEFKPAAQVEMETAVQSSDGELPKKDDGVLDTSVVNDDLDFDQPSPSATAAEADFEFEPSQESSQPAPETLETETFTDASNLKLAEEALGFGEDSETQAIPEPVGGGAAIEEDFGFEPAQPEIPPTTDEFGADLGFGTDAAKDDAAELPTVRSPADFQAQKLDFDSQSPSPVISSRRASEQNPEPRGSIGQDDAPAQPSSAERRVSFRLEEGDQAAAITAGLALPATSLQETQVDDWSAKEAIDPVSDEGIMDDDDFSYAGPPQSESSSLMATASSSPPPVHAGLSLEVRTPEPPAIPRLDLSFNDVAPPSSAALEERRSSRASLGSQTPSGSFYAAPISSVRPIPAAERFALWSAALKAFQKNKGEDVPAEEGEEDEEDDEDEAAQDQSVCPKALEVLDAISNSKLQGARLVFALRRVWGGALGVRGIGFVDPQEAHIGERTGSLLRALFGYHDPELTLHLDYITSFTWSRQPSLFGFYGGQDAVLELWDLGIVKVHPGFETPQCGSMFFAFGVCASKRAQLLSARTMDEVFALFAEANLAMRASHDEASRWAIFASRIARETPRTFRNLLSQIELDLSSLSESPVFEDGMDEDYFLPPQQQPSLDTSGAGEDDLRAPSEVFSIDDDTPAIVAPARKAGSVSSLPMMDDRTSVDSSNRLESVPSLFDAVSSKGASSSTTSTAATAGGGWSKWKDIASKTAKQWQERLAGPIDEAESSQQQQQHMAAHGNKSRRIHLLVLDQGHLGCKLSLTKQGLMCVGFPASGAGKQMERRGLREGDLIHAINGATVLLLPPAVAESVAQRQERPLYVTIGTSNEELFKRPLNQERLAETKKMLLKPLSEFYARHGPAKVDRCEEIIELYAGKERALLGGLFEKYGEFVPGDEYLRCDSGAALVTADEIVDYLERPDDKDHLLVDIRDITERADTGYFASSVLYGHADVTERLKEAKRTYLIGSGRARELSIADPTRAKAEARLDLERTKIIVERLWKEGIRHVAVVQGGYAQVARELRQRQVDVLVISQGAGVDFRLLDTYLKLDYDDPLSVAQFLTSHVSGKATKQRRSSSVVSDSLGEQQQTTSSMGTRKPSMGSIASSSRRSGAEQLEGEDGDGLLPAPPPGVVQQQGGAGPQAPPVITREQLSAATAATAKAASAAAKDAAVLASNAWSKWVAPALMPG